MDIQPDVRVYEHIDDDLDLLSFLQEVDRSFPIPLSDKTPLTDYANKLRQHASATVVMQGDTITSAVFAYLDDTTCHMGYITMVATHEAHRGKGYAGTALDAMCQLASSKGLHGIHLYTDARNSAAQAMYDSHGFIQERFANEQRPEDVHYLKLFNQCALVTAIGSFSANAAISTLKSQGYRVIGCDIYPATWVASSADVDAFYQISPAANRDAFLADIAQIVNTEGVSYVLPSTDYEVDALTGIESIGSATICCSSAKSLSYCRDKLASYALLAKGVPGACIPSYRASELPVDFDMFPAVCKPLNGRSSSGLVYAKDRDQLEQVLEQVDREQYCVQPRVQGSIVTVDIVRNAISGRTIAVPREELLRTPNGAGTSVRVFHNDALTKLACSIAQELGVNGCVNLEFIASNDGYRFLECNPRFSGGVAFTQIAAYDCATNHLRCFQGLEIADLDTYGERYIARRYHEYVMA